MSKASIYSGKKRTGLIVLFIGVAILIVGTALIFDSLTFMNNAVEAVATVTDIESESKTFNSHDKNRSRYYHIEFTVDGQLIHTKVRDVDIDAGADVGSVINIHYDSRNPERVRPKAVTSELFFILIGTPVTIVGLVMFLKAVGKEKRAKKLQKNGIHVKGVIVDVYTDTSVSVNGVSPSWAECEVEDPETKAVYKFRSEKVYKELGHLKGREVDISFDPKNPDDYYIDFAALLENQPEQEEDYEAEC